MVQSKIIVAFIGAGVLAVALGTWKFVSYRRKYAAAIRAQWLRDQADEAAIRELAWKGDTPEPVNLPEDELAAKIRAAMEERKRDAAAGTAFPNS